MRTISEVLRLRFECGLSQRQIALSCGVSRATIGEYLARAAAAGLRWPLPAGMDEVSLEARLFPSGASAKKGRRRSPTGPMFIGNCNKKGSR